MLQYLLDRIFPGVYSEWKKVICSYLIRQEFLFSGCIFYKLRPLLLSTLNDMLRERSWRHQKVDHISGSVTAHIAAKIYSIVFGYPLNPFRKVLVLQLKYNPTHTVLQRR